MNGEGINGEHIEGTVLSKYWQIHLVAFFENKWDVRLAQITAYLAHQFVIHSTHIAQ